MVYQFVIFYLNVLYFFFFFFSSRRRHTRCSRDWSSDVCSSDLLKLLILTVQIVIYFLHQSHSLRAHCRWNTTTKVLYGYSKRPLSPSTHCLPSPRSTISVMPALI